MLLRKAPPKFPTLPAALAPVLLLASASLLALPALTAPSRAHGSLAAAGLPIAASGASVAYSPDFTASPIAAAFGSRRFDFHALLNFVGFPVGPSSLAAVRAERATAATPPVGFVGKAYSYDLAAGLGPPANRKTLDPRDATWTVASGQLPAGLLLSPDGVISGTPEAAAHTVVRVQALYVTSEGVHSYEFEIHLEILEGKQALALMFPAAV